MKFTDLMAETPPASRTLPVVRRAGTFILASSTWWTQMRTTDWLARRDGGEGKEETGGQKKDGAQSLLNRTRSSRAQDA